MTFEYTFFRNTKKFYNVVNIYNKKYFLHIKTSSRFEINYGTRMVTVISCYYIKKTFRSSVNTSFGIP